MPIKSPTFEVEHLVYPQLDYLDYLDYLEEDPVEGLDLLFEIEVPLFYNMEVGEEYLIDYDIINMKTLKINHAFKIDYLIYGADTSLFIKNK